MMDMAADAAEQRKDLFEKERKVFDRAMEEYDKWQARLDERRAHDAQENRGLMAVFHAFTEGKRLRGEEKTLQAAREKTQQQFAARARGHYGAAVEMLFAAHPDAAAEAAHIDTLHRAVDVARKSIRYAGDGFTSFSPAGTALAAQTLSDITANVLTRLAATYDGMDARDFPVNGGAVLESTRAELATLRQMNAPAADGGYAAAYRLAGYLDTVERDLRETRKENVIDTAAARPQTDPALRALLHDVKAVLATLPPPSAPEKVKVSVTRTAAAHTP